MPSSRTPGSQIGPLVSVDSIRLHLPAHVANLEGVRLDLDFPLKGDLNFTPDGASGWELEVHRPPVRRFEYKLRMLANGHEMIAPDPTNPRQVPGPFGAKSEIRFPDYQEPRWLHRAVNGTTIHVVDEPYLLDVPVPVWLFTPVALRPDEPAPLLLAHDGSDLADRGGLLSWACAAGRPIRVALLDPPNGYRNAWYGASVDYAEHISSAVLPALQELVPITSVIGLGVSLGAVATMMIHRRHPWAFDAMVLQSGSFFRLELDQQESDWPEFRPVVQAVAQMAGASRHEVREIPVLMTVGSVEENRANNERMAGAMAFQGYDLNARIVPDSHNVIGWRDAWFPWMNRLLEKMP